MYHLKRPQSQKASRKVEICRFFSSKSCIRRVFDRRRFSYLKERQMSLSWHILRFVLKMWLSAIIVRTITVAKPKIIEKFKIVNLNRDKCFLESNFRVESIFGTFRAIRWRITNLFYILWSKNRISGLFTNYQNLSQLSSNRSKTTHRGEKSRSECQKVFPWCVRHVSRLCDSFPVKTALIWIFECVKSISKNNFFNMH